MTAAAGFCDNALKSFYANAELEKFLEILGGTSADRRDFQVMFQVLFY